MRQIRVVQRIDLRPCTGAEVSFFEVKADPYAIGILRIICALILSLLLDIHKVCLRNNAFAKTQFLLQSARAAWIIIYLDEINKTEE